MNETDRVTETHRERQMDGWIEKQTEKKRLERERETERESERKREEGSG